MTLEKPSAIAANPIKSQKWDELTRGRSFQDKDIPALSLLCQWYAVVAKCEEDMVYGDDIQVAYQNNLGDIKALPQIGTMKQASAEIRALNKQLGINDEVAISPEKKETKLYVIQTNRQSKAKNMPRAKTG